MIIKSPLPDVTVPEVPITTFVLQQVQEFADKPALIEGPTGRTVTYSQLYDSIRRVAVNLSKRGLKQGEVFAILSPNHPEYAILFHAIASLGGIATTLNPLYTAREIFHQLKDSKARFLATVPAGFGED